MRWDEDPDQFDEEWLAEEVLPATIAPVPDDIFETLVLMRLEAGIITDEDLPDLDWENLPDMPVDEMEPKDEAQHLAFVAYDLCFEDPETAAEIAREAIDTDPMCIDASVAYWFTRDIQSEEALVAAGAAVARGQILLDGTEDVRFVEDLWQYPRIRSVVRAWAALALTDWAHGHREEAIEAAEEAFRLAPEDNAHISPHLVNWYLATGATKSAYRLLRDISYDDFAALPYARALVEFIRSGPGNKARSKLLAASREHPFIMLYLGSENYGIMDRPDPFWPSHVYVPGSFEEAVVWYGPIIDAWEATEGALDWAQQCFEDSQFKAFLEPTMHEFIAEAESLGFLDEFDEDGDGDVLPGGPDLRLL